jgi:hypothetical protein
MKFSIRDILILTSMVALVALTFVSYRNWREAESTTARILQANVSIERQIEIAKLNSEPSHVAIERCEMIAEATSQLEGHFPNLAQKYSSIETRDDGTLSMRSIPVLFDRTSGIDVQRTLLRIPSTRPVYLKIGVTDKDKGSKSEATTEWLTNSDYSSSGPFEVLLQPGDCTIDWSQENVGEHRIRFHVNVHGLCQWATDIDKTSGHSSTAPSAMSQLDFRSTQELPLLLRIRHSRDAALGQLHLHLWLDDKSSGFRKPNSVVLTR